MKHEYCDLSLPVPLDQAFTYRLPETLRHRVQRGSRVSAPFGARKLTGVVLRVHDERPQMTAREVFKLLDEEPVLSEELLSLGKWIAAYYCAPLGEVLRSMTPLAGEVRRGKQYSLTDTGRDAARQMLLGAANDDPQIEMLRLLEARPMSESYLKSKFDNAKRMLQALEKKGFLDIEDVEASRDPLRAAAERLRVEIVRFPDGKFPKAERELLAFLELHPGSHNLADVGTRVKSASESARSLARKQIVTLVTEHPLANQGPVGPPKTLNIYQMGAFNAIDEALRTNEYKAFLLQGVTGSGKTEVYLKSIEAALAYGKSALLLVPEIALTPAVAGQFFGRFGETVAILHSAFNDAERAEQWRRIRSGKSKVVVGTRSGVFAPVRNLGLIIVDEEHDSSYKQGETPRYHGRDVAVMRAHAAKALVVLGSATPSLESRYNAGKNKYTMLELPERIERRPMPQVELVDMRLEFIETRKQSTFSRKLVEAVDARLINGEQTMLLLNRRGFSSFVACRACGERISCINCSVTLTFHRRDRRLLCHYCNYAEKVPSVCPKCQSEHIHFMGVGSEKAEDELHRDFPKARIARLDRDTASAKKQVENILNGFRERNFDILVGTQMIAKGHDIPNVTLVGIINADIGLGMPDFRAAERTFQLLTQAAGRAGRGELPGIVLIQTTNPDHYAVRHAARQDYEKFYEQEIQFRRAMRYPPFSALANLLVRSEKQEEAMRMSAELARLIEPAPEGIKMLGPAQAPVERLKTEYRYQLLLKASSRVKLNELLAKLRNYAHEQKWSATALVIDVDPLSLM